MDITSIVNDCLCGSVVVSMVACDNTKLATAATATL